MNKSSYLFMALLVGTLVFGFQTQSYSAVTAANSEITDIVDDINDLFDELDTETDPNLRVALHRGIDSKLGSLTLEYAEANAPGITYQFLYVPDHAIFLIVSGGNQVDVENHAAALAQEAGGFTAADFVTSSGNPDPDPIPEVIVAHKVSGANLFHSFGSYSNP